MNKDHFVTLDPHGENGLTAMCWCGWKKWHKRMAVLKKAGDRHVTKANQASG